eukprot:5476395-Amphidinium_carterae.1
MASVIHASWGCAALRLTSTPFPNALQHGDFPSLIKVVARGFQRSAVKDSQAVRIQQRETITNCTKTAKIHGIDYTTCSTITIRKRTWILSDTYFPKQMKIDRHLNCIPLEYADRIA